MAEAQAADKAFVPEGTARAYRCDWKAVQRFVRVKKLAALAARAETARAYLAARSRRHRVSTTRRRLAVIGAVHRICGLANPLDESRMKQTRCGMLCQRRARQVQIAPALLRGLRAT